MPILNSITQMQDEMKKWRQELHKIPEIGLEEYKTSAFIKNKLNEWNINYIKKVLNWEPFVNFDDGIREVINWYVEKNEETISS